MRIRKIRSQSRNSPLLWGTILLIIVGLYAWYVLIGRLLLQRVDPVTMTQDVVDVQEETSPVQRELGQSVSLEGTVLVADDPTLSYILRDTDNIRYWLFSNNYDIATYVDTEIVLSWSIFLFVWSIPLIDVTRIQE